ncbi:MAG: hypothetical protein AABP62_02555 [Planctomycetota bacterium]
MPRIVEADRLPMVDGNINHYGEANTIHGTPVELVTGFGLPQLLLLRDQYQAKADAIRELEETTLPVLRAERDAIWGVSPTDDQGVWFWLTQYKNLVKVRLGARHPLARTIPNFGDVVIYRYAGIIQQFLDHWARVNAALTPDMTLGAFTITTLQTALTNLQAKLTAVSAGESELALFREEREQLFGDETEEERDPTSLVARLALYHGIIQTMFPNQPLSDSLPDIFPPESSSGSTTFAFNWSVQAGGGTKTKIVATSLPYSSATVFLKKGIEERTAPVHSNPPGGIQVNEWPALTIIDELDQFELRNNSGLTVATGNRDESLPEPA